jgi:uncharacterized protein YcgL (UPF0745 family)
MREKDADLTKPDLSRLHQSLQKQKGSLPKTVFGLSLYLKPAESPRRLLDRVSTKRWREQLDSIADYYLQLRPFDEAVFRSAVLYTWRLRLIGEYIEGASVLFAPLRRRYQQLLAEASREDPSSQRVAPYSSGAKAAHKWGGLIATQFYQPELDQRKVISLLEEAKREISQAGRSAG